ncbi:MAG: hypothetical protein MUE70_00305 [Desulfobacterales bacterium]|jgi:hypothetical protein|nr:hypothetical protein [Desulfobacterales bacterium]
MKAVKSYIQAIWGGALLLMGIAVFFRIPHIMAKLSHVEQYASGNFFLRFCLYLMGVLLVGGGIKKLYVFIKSPPGDFSS